MMEYREKGMDINGLLRWGEDDQKGLARGFYNRTMVFGTMGGYGCLLDGTARRLGFEHTGFLIVSVVFGSG